MNISSLFDRFHFQILFPSILFLLVLSLPSAAQFQKQSKHIGATTGLPTNDISHLFQDSYGYIWISTANGVSKYDGYTVKNYYNKREDSTSLYIRNVFYTTEDGCGNLWVITQKGLSLYNRNTDDFTNYTQDNSKLIHNFIGGYALDKHGNLLICSGNGVNRFDCKNEMLQSIYIDSLLPYVNIRLLTGITVDDKNKIWIGTESNGVLLLNPLNNKLQHFSKKINSQSWLLSDSIYTLYCDKKNNIWVSYSNNRMTRYNLQEQKAYHFAEFSSTITSIYEDKSGTLYFGTDGSGVLIYEHGVLTQKNKQNCDLFNDKVRTVLKDDQNSIWVGYRHGGVSFYKSNNNPIYTMSYSAGNNLPYNLVNDIVVDRYNSIWIANDKGGVHKITGGEISDMSAQYPELQETAICLLETSTGDMWVGTYKGGACLIDNNTKKVTKYKHTESATSIAGNDVRSMDEDRNGNIWFALHGYGFSKFDSKTKEFVNYHFQDTTVFIKNGEWSYSILCDNNYVWVGTTIGLYRYNQLTETGEFFRNIPQSHNSISSNVVFTLYLDSKGNVWAGTEMGLNKFDYKTEQFTSYFQSDGLSEDGVNSIIEDDAGNIWLGTGKGISKLNPETNEIKNYNSSDGFQGNEFARDACFKSPDGMLYFGGFNGFSRFHPQELKINSTPPKIHISDFSLFNKTVIANDNGSPIKTNILDADFITLNHKQNMLGFEFTAINYINTDKNQYAYKLEGLDPDWIYCGQERKVNYTNLRHGEYIFKVKASNNDGIWSDTVRSIRITVNPPFWLRWYAYIIYLFILIALLYLFRKYSIISATKKNEIVLQHLEQEKIKEIHQAKLRFFTDVSHEIRTPLTLVIDPIERLIKNWKGDTETGRQLALIQKNSSKMLTLINQLLDFRKVETGNEILQCSEVNLYRFVNDLTDGFTDYCNQKKILLSFPQKSHEIICWADTVKLDKILTNLLSNAIKYTKEGGTINVNISTHNAVSKNYPEGFVSITVSDTGIGIPAGKLNTIFGRFTQIDSSSEAIGSGIGLALAKHLTELHHGQLTVSSEAGKGSIFTCILPLGKTHLTDGELKKTRFESQLPTARTEKTHTTEPSTDTQDHDQKKATLLLVEDNPEILKYFADVLIEDFNIITASNGRDGADLALDTVPDIILSDVRMPEMDGNEMTKLLKSTPATSHIPIVLLTARHLNEQQLESLELGADAYITKPVDTNLLKLTIRNLLNTLKNQHARIKLHIVQQADVPEELMAEYSFLNKAQKLVEKQLANSHLSVQDLATEMGMSRTQLFRKFKAVLNQNPKDYIQSTRLNYARKLLEGTDLSVKEVAYQVGFSDPRYFSRCFSKEFNISPSKLGKPEKE